MVVQVQREAVVDMSQVGVSVSRLLTNSGSRPSDSRNISVTVLGLIVHPSSAAWQVPQSRPFVPCGVKKLLLSETMGAVVVLYDAASPCSFGIGKLFGRLSTNSSSNACCFVSPGPSESCGPPTEQADDAATNNPIAVDADPRCFVMNDLQACAGR